MRLKRLIILGLLVTTLGTCIGCSNKEETTDTAVENNTEEVVTNSKSKNSHKGTEVKYTTAKLNKMRLYYRGFTNISFNVDNTNGLDGRDPATSVLNKVELDTKNKVFYNDTQIAVVGNETIAQPRIFYNATDDFWCRYDSDTNSFIEVADTADFIVPQMNVYDYNTVEDFLVFYMDNYPLPEEMNGVLEDGVEYYTYSEPATENDIIGVRYDALGEKVYDLAIKPLPEDNYELVHFNVSVSYRIGTSIYSVQSNMMPTRYSNDEVSLPDNYAQLIQESSIPPKPLYDDLGSPILDAFGEQLYAPALYNEDGTPMLDANGNQMYDMSVLDERYTEEPITEDNSLEHYENQETSLEDGLNVDDTNQTEEEVSETTEEVEEIEE